jgi:hypothetical protein
MNLLSLRNPSFRLGSIVGLLGGAALLAVPIFGFRGPAIYVPYTGLVLTLATLAGVHREFGRWDRFELVFTGFMVASLVLYLYIILIDSPSALDIPLLGHAWRLGFLASVGTVLAAATAFFTERQSRPVATG